MTPAPDDDVSDAQPREPRPPGRTWSTQRVIARLPGPTRRPARLAVATLRDAGRDRITGLAAEIAFWVLLSLPSMLLAAASLAGFIGDRIAADVRGQLIARIEEIALQVFSADAVTSTLTPTLDGLLEDGSASLLSLSFLITVYTASRVLRVVVHAIAIAYDLAEARPSWLARIIGFAFTLVSLVLGLVLIPAVVAGPRLGQIIEDRLAAALNQGLEDLALAEIWRAAYWPTSLLVLTVLIAALYHFAAPWRTPFRRELPGALLATLMGLAVSTGLRTYTELAFGGDAVYASLAAPLAILVWVWLLAIGLLLGAELNAEIERSDPVGHPAPEPPRLGDLGRRAIDGVRSLTTSSPDN